jgi:adenine-specific DNA-methyltransferase
MAKRKSAATKVESIRHKDKRKNIPTEELRDFVADDELAPKTMLYPRDPSLDPQLVWKGKDEQDRADLIVPVVPIYIQEKIHPQAIIDALPRIEQSGDDQLNLFADFNGGPLDFDKKVDFYHHEQNWSNRLILGDSLLVMTSLAEKEGLKGKVQTIYLDPPYGIKFPSNWQLSTRNHDVKDGKAEDVTRQPEQIRAFRDTWKYGIHSYLPYLRDRLVVARELLTETGSVFMQIGDENVHLVRNVMDEVFGSDNFISLIAFRKKTMPFGTNFIEQMGDFIIWYAKQKHMSDGKPLTKYRPLKRDANVEGEFHHCWFEMPDCSRHRMTPKQVDNHALLPIGARVYRLKSLEPSGPMASGKFDYEFEGKMFPPPSNGYGTTLAGMDRLKTMRRLQAEGNRLTFIMYADENPAAALTAPWFDTIGADDKQYVVQTNTEVVRRCLLMTTDPGDLVLDPTCGSGTSAYVAEQWGRRWITCDTSRVALALARTRLMAAKYPYYLLADSTEGIKK